MARRSIVISLIAIFGLLAACSSSGSDLQGPSLTVEPEEGLLSAASIGDMDDAAGIAVLGDVPLDVNLPERLVVRMVADTDDSWELQDPDAVECIVPDCDLRELNPAVDVVEIQWLIFDSRPTPRVEVNGASEDVSVAIRIGGSVGRNDDDSALTPSVVRAVLYLSAPLGERTLSVSISQ